MVEFDVHFTRPVYVDGRRPTDVEFTVAVQSVDQEGRTAVIALSAATGGDRIFGRAAAKVLLG